MYKKIAIIGISGSGKTFISRKLATHLGLPLFHMDSLFWKGKWKEVAEEDYLKKHQELIGKSEWIIDGYVDEKMSNRLSEAELIIYLDYSGLLCFLRVLKRWVNHRRVSRPELPKEALEQFKLEFLWRVLKRKERVPTEKALRYIDSTKVKRLKSPKDLEQFFEKHFHLQI